MFADVRRGLTVAAVVEAATVVDTDGTVIDTTEFFGSPEAAAEAAAAAEDEGAEEESTDAEGAAEPAEAKDA